MIVPLREAESERDFGGKAVQLGHALRAGLPVPPGWALATSFVDRVTSGDPEAEARLGDAFGALASPVAVRSSAIGEDGAGASFAGQHATVLNVRSREGLLAAVREVDRSARTDAAMAYRRRLGLTEEARMGVVVQALVPAECAGVLFTRHPVTGADERVIEATWGLGEAVVAGLVTPDAYRVARGGHVLERRAGDKDLAILWRDAGGTEEVPIPPERAQALCLDDAKLAALDRLAVACERAFEGPQDLEFAFVGARLHLLQRRAITRG